MTHVVVAALYHFVTLPDYQALRDPLHDACVEHGIKGTFLLAAEGINGTVAGSREGIDGILNFLRTAEIFAGRLAALKHKESFVEKMPFHRTKVKLKKEIVTMGVPTVDPNNIVGTHVDAATWNALLEDPDVLVIDTRNDYEVDIGTFKNAVSPNTKTFREFPDYVARELDPQKHKKVAMFCTGGIRCEKSTSYLLSQGFENVYHLNGGILKYLEEVPLEENLWQGECFVFDGRVAVNDKLEKGQYEQCFACRHPVSQAEMASADYVPGVSCPHCIDAVSEEQRQRFSERQKQVTLAKQRGQKHIGPT